MSDPSLLATVTQSDLIRCPFAEPTRRPSLQSLWIVPAQDPTASPFSSQIPWFSPRCIGQDYVHHLL